VDDSTPSVVIAVSIFLTLNTKVNMYPPVVAHKRISVAEAAMIEIGSMSGDANRDAKRRETVVCGRG